MYVISSDEILIFNGSAVYEKLQYTFNSQLKPVSAIAKVLQSFQFKSLECKRS